MKRSILIAVCIMLMVSVGLVYNPLSPRQANGQDNISSFFDPGLDIAGVYVEGTPPLGSSPRIVVLYADGNWTVRILGAPPSFGVWKAIEEGTTPDVYMLDAVLAPSLDDPPAATAPYTLVFDSTLQSVTVTNTSTMAGFTAQRLSVTNTTTDTSTTTTTDTSTTTTTDTSTSTIPDTSTTTTTDTSTSTIPDTSTTTSTGTVTGTGTTTFTR